MQIRILWRPALALLGYMALVGIGNASRAQDVTPPPLPAPAASDQPLPINLATALQLAQVRPLDIAIASQRVRVAAAQLDRARVLWLPSVVWGADYARHDGRLQDIVGTVLDTSRSSFMAGAGPYAVFALSDAIFDPLAARQVLAARRAEVQAAANDSLLAVAEAYFNVQQARGDLAGAEDVVRKAEELVRRAEKLAPGIVSPLEANRARAELARRRQVAALARERWRVASAELARVLRLAPSALVEPLEPPHLQVTLLPPDQPVDDLVAVALTNRPELAAQQALVQATLARLRQERLRPLIPSVLLRGNATNPAGTLSSGYFGGGINDQLSAFGGRNSIDVQVLWELQNLGLGNRARINERRAENQLSMVELFRLQDRVAAEAAQAHAQVVSAAERVREAETGVREAGLTVERSFDGLGQTKRAGELIILIIRPQEVVAAVQALGQAYNDYYGTVGDYNRAQFRLYRALGHPAQLVPCMNETPPAER